MTDAHDAPPALVVEDLTVSYGEEAVVASVSFTVAAGEVVAIVGESGSGKSTTAQAILGLLSAEARRYVRSIRIDGIETRDLNEHQLRAIRGRRVGYVPQDPGTSLDPMRRAGRQVADVLRVHAIGGGRGRKNRVETALREAGVADPERVGRSFPHQLSGGLQQRVLIAQAIVADARLVIADEPTSALDVTVQQEILDNLARATSERGTAVLLITHDLGLAVDRADRVLVLKDGVLVEHGPARRVLAHPQHAYTRSLVAASPASIADSLRHRRAQRDPVRSDILQVAGLNKSFGSRRQTVVAVEDVAFSLSRGRTLALVGESGSGKTTTARIVSRLELPDSGTVTYEGEDILRLRGEQLRQLRRRIQYVHQNPRAALDPRFTVGEAIAEPLRAFARRGETDIHGRVGELLELVALPATLRERSTAHLSGGQAQRVAIARALALSPSVLVLDEAVSALDVSVQARILSLLTELRQRLDLAYLFVSHDLSVVAQIADDVLVMRGGRVVESGPTLSVFENPSHSYTQRLLNAVPGRAGVA
jgi:peptide/nickel transport system ATP-binding protein